MLHVLLSQRAKSRVSEVFQKDAYSVVSDEMIGSLVDPQVDLPNDIKVWIRVDVELDATFDPLRVT